MTENFYKDTAPGIFCLWAVAIVSAAETESLALPTTGIDDVAARPALCANKRSGPMPSVAAAPTASTDTSSAGDSESERWNLYYQATSIGDYHGTFRAPYSGPLSLENNPERDVSLTTTLFFAARL